MTYYLCAQCYAMKTWGLRIEKDKNKIENSRLPKCDDCNNKAVIKGDIT